MKNLKYTLLLVVLSLIMSNSLFAQRVLIGPRIAGNYNIYNQKGLTGSYNGVGVSIGGQVDALFNKNIGILVNLNFFDMRNFSNSTTTNNVNTDASYTLSYATLDPMFQANFSNFYFGTGVSVGFKLNSTGEVTTSATGQTPQVTPSDIATNSVAFNIALATGYNFALSPSMQLGTDFNVYIPISNTYDVPGLSNSILTLKLGVALKFRI